MSDTELRFDRQDRELAEAPATWIPALLTTLITAAVKKQVFKEPDGLTTFVAAVKRRSTDQPSEGAQ